jgi:hypothetical protein
MLHVVVSEVHFTVCELNAPDGSHVRANGSHMVLYGSHMRYGSHASPCGCHVLLYGSCIQGSHMMPLRPNGTVLRVYKEGHI